jgi:dienelactone hydrolase
MRRILLAITSVLAIGVLMGGCAGPAAAPPTSAPTTEAAPPPPCNDAAMRDARATFKNSVGGALDGYVLGTGSTGIVLANELDTNACDWKPYAKQLADRGYRVLAFDFNGDKRSGYVQGSSDDDDVVSAAAFLRQQGAQKIVLIGASRGGTAVLVAATKIQPPVAGVISLSGPGMFGGMNAVSAVPTLSMPVLFVAADMDGSFATDAQTMYNSSPKGLATLALMEGGGHGMQFPLGGAASSVRAMTAVDDFLTAHAPVA